jgi:hypothetical protein
MKAIKPLSANITPRHAARAAILGVTYLLALWASTSLIDNHWPAFWVCNAFIAAMVLLLEGSPLLWVSYGAVAVASTIFLHVSSPSWGNAMLRMAFNLGEGVAAGYLARWALGPRRLLRTTSGFLKLVLLAVLPAVFLNWQLHDLQFRIRGKTDVLVVDSWRSVSSPICSGWR